MYTTVHVVTIYYIDSFALTLQLTVEIEATFCPLGDGVLIKKSLNNVVKYYVVTYTASIDMYTFCDGIFS